MKIRYVTVTTAITIALSTLPFSFPKDKSIFDNVRVVSIFDGDTIKVNIPSLPDVFGKEISVRLAGIDTAERRTRKECQKAIALEARNLVRQLVGVEMLVDLRQCKRGKYFRLVCNVIAKGIDLSQRLIENKLAYRYDGGTKKEIDWCNFK